MMTQKQKNEIIIREGYPPLVLYYTVIYLYSISEKKYRCNMYVCPDGFFSFTFIVTLKSFKPFHSFILQIAYNTERY